MIFPHYQPMLTEALAGAMGGETHGQGTLPPDCLVLLQGLLWGVGWVAKGEQVWQALGGGEARRVWWLVMLWVG